MGQFKIAAAQIACNRGDLQGNIQRHLDAITLAAGQSVSIVIFPELSLMGYEPDIAQEFALDPDDARLASIADLAQRHRMQVVAGASITSRQQKPHLGAFVFGEDGSRRVYAKMHMGGCESAYFIPGDTLMSIASHGEVIGLSICADASKRSHPAAYASTGASVYAASVFFNAQWYVADSPRYAAYAANLGMLVLMANHAASAGSLVSVGNSAVWAPDGSLLACAAGTQAALVMATRTGESWAGEVLRL